MTFTCFHGYYQNKITAMIHVTKNEFVVLMVNLKAENEWQRKAPSKFHQHRGSINCQNGSKLSKIADDMSLSALGWMGCRIR